MAVKDSADIIGRTTMAKDEGGGEHEARERFIEEAGTSVLWLGGIPFCQKLFDKTIFKKAGLNPDLNIKKIFQQGPQQLKEQELRNLTPKLHNHLTHSQLKTKYKNYHVAKFLFSTLVPFSLLSFALPKLNQHISREIILENAKKENEIQKNKVKERIFNSDKQLNYRHELIKKKLYGNLSSENTIAAKNATIESDKRAKFLNNSPAYKMTFANAPDFSKNLGFTGIGKSLSCLGDKLLAPAAASQISAVDNMLILDLGISGNRIAFVPRNEQERTETAVKEGGIIFFFFFASKMIKNGFEKLSNAMKIPVDLDFKTLFSNKFVQKMEDISSTTNSPTKTKQKLEALTQYTTEEGKKALLSETKTDKKIGFFSKITGNIKNWFKPSGPMKDSSFEKHTFNYIKDNFNKPEASYTLQIAKELGVIKTITDKGKIKLDPTKYIETKNVKKISDDITKFTEAMLKSDKKPKEFINMARSLKAGMLLANLTLCNLALGYALPKIQYIIREKFYGSKEFPGTRAYEQEAKKLMNQGYDHLS